MPTVRFTARTAPTVIHPNPWRRYCTAPLLAPSGLLALVWRERLGRVAGQAQAFLRFLVDRDLHRRLLDERRALVEELRAAADRVPLEVLESSGGATAPERPAAL